jgi:hypothetical protein
VDRPALLDLDVLGLGVQCLAEHVPHVAERRIADRDRDRRAGVLHGSPSYQTVGGLHRDRPDDVVANLARDLEGQSAGVVAEGALAFQRVVDLGHVLRPELDVDDRADDTDDTAGAALRRGRLLLERGGHRGPLVIVSEASNFVG